jgi:predicted nucleotidyltransferase
MPRLDLAVPLLEITQRLLSLHVPGAEVWAYGSRVGGESHPGSDLDLVLRHPTDPSVPQRNLAVLREAFIASDLPILVDVIDWARIPESSRREIAQAHVVVQHGKRPVSAGG